MKKILVIACSFVFVLAALIAITEPKEEKQSFSQPFQQQQPLEPQLRFPAKPSVADGILAYKNYNETFQQLDMWKEQSPGLVETGTYGVTARGQKITYIRVTNLLDPTPKKKVLITSCIHGNEPLSASTTMAFIATMLANYTVDKEVTDLINTRDIYFVPVVSPDSYPNSRIVDGVDPNRDFPSIREPSHRSTPSVVAIQNFFNQKKFNAVISGHTYGRVYLYPWGESTKPCSNKSDYTALLGKMGQFSNYRMEQACEMYNEPIYGTEIDWYYKGGAFAIVCEYGTHQRIPSMEDIKYEFDKTYKATLIFIREAPLVSIKSWYNLTENRFMLSPSLLKTWDDLLRLGVR